MQQRDRDHRGHLGRLTHLTDVRRGRDERAMTIVELLVALTVLAVGIAAVTTTLLATLRVAGTSSNRTRGVALAARELEALRALPFDRLRAAPDGAVALGPDPVVESGVTFTVSRSVIDTGNPATTRRVGVVVRWHDESGDHTVAQETVIASPTGFTTTTSTPGTAATATGLRADVNADVPDREIDLTWSFTGVAPDYWEVQHSLSSSFSPTYIDTASQPGALTTYRKTGLSSGTTYWFRVRPAGASDASWSVPAAASTAADLSGVCAVRSVGVKPGAVRRTNGNTLSDDIAVEVNASEACTSFRLRFRPLTNKAPIVVELTRPAGGSSWTATIGRANYQWDAGDHDLEVLAAGVADVVATMSLDVCRQQARACP